MQVLPIRLRELLTEIRLKYPRSTVSEQDIQRYESYVEWQNEKHSYKLSKQLESHMTSFMKDFEERMIRKEEKLKFIDACEEFQNYYSANKNKNLMPVWDRRTGERLFPIGWDEETGEVWK